VAIVNSSRSEGVSNAIMEAMALGVPVLARNCAGNRSIVTHNKTGLLFGTDQEFLTLAQQLLKDERLKQNLIHGGKEFISQRCTSEKLAYQKLFEDLEIS